MSKRSSLLFEKKEFVTAQIPMQIEELSIEAVEKLEGSILLEAFRDVASEEAFFAKHSSHSSYTEYPSGPGGNWVSVKEEKN